MSLKIPKITKYYKTLASQAVHIFLNIALAVALFIIIRQTDSLLIAVIFVAISKWRVFAVKTRFWWGNIQANAVCSIISLSYVIFLYLANNFSDISMAFIWQAILMVLYIIWLVIIKPKTKRLFVAVQGYIALLVGSTALLAFSADWWVSPVVIIFWVIGYSSARHILNSYDEESHVTVLSMCWGFVLAELGWLFSHWTIAYPILPELLLPQATIIIAGLSFMIYKAYDSYYHNGRIRREDILLPMIFSIVLILFLVLLRNSAPIGLN